MATEKEYILINNNQILTQASALLQSLLVGEQFGIPVGERLEMVRRIDEWKKAAPPLHIEVISERKNLPTGY